MNEECVESLTQTSVDNKFTRTVSVKIYQVDGKHYQLKSELRTTNDNAAISHEYRLFSDIKTLEEARALAKNTIEKVEEFFKDVKNQDGLQINVPNLVLLLENNENEWEWYKDCLAVEANYGFNRKQVTQSLINLLKDKDPDVRSAAAYTLGDVGKKLVFNALIKTLQNDSNSEVRYMALEALGHFISYPYAKDSVEPLIKALKDQEEKIRYKVANALGNLGDWRAVDPLLEMFEGETELVRSAIAMAFSAFNDDRVIELLLKALKDQNYLIRRSAALALGELKCKQAVDSLIPMLKDEAVGVRYFTAVALGEIGDKQAVRPLIEALNEEDERVRGVVVQALGDLGDAQAIDPLLQANNLRPSGVIVALGKFHDLRSIPVLIEALGDESIRDSARRGLYNLREYSIPALLQALQHEQSLIRYGAVRVLGEIGDPQAIEPLIKVLDDPEPDVVESAISALGLIGIREPIESLHSLATHPNSKVREFAAKILAYFK